MILIVPALLFIFLIGYLAQTSGLCMVRGVDEALSGKPSFLLAILFSGTFGWVSLVAALVFDLNNPFVSYSLNLWVVFGGLLFGVGAALNRGCGISTISKLARGQIIMVITVLGWLIGWWLERLFPIEVIRSTYSLPIGVHLSTLLALSFMPVLLAFRFSREERKVWIAMLVIGLVAGVVFLIEPNWTPSGLLRDLSLAGLNRGSPNWPSPERFWFFLSLIGGMIVAAVLTRSFAFQTPTVNGVLRHLFAGILMGAGAAVAGGGNDSQLLLALPSLSVAGMVTVGSILCGIYASNLVKSEIARFSR